jgi:hypothetical protein
MATAQKVVSIRMSVGNNTVIGRIERDFIEHAELNALLAGGWRIVQGFQASGTQNGAYTALTFILEKEIPDPAAE